MPGTPTTKYNLPTMAGADLINQVDEWTVAFGAAVDPLLAPSDQGLLTNRPTSTGGSPSNKPGRTYFATDTLQLFRDNGAGWVEIILSPVATAALADGAVTPAKLSSGAKPTSGFVSPSAGSTVLAGSPGAWTDMPGLTATITPTVASIADIDFSVLFQLLGGGAGSNAWGEARLSVDNVDVGAHGRARVTGNAQTVVIPAAGAAQAALSVAAHTVKVQVRSELQDAGSNIWAIGASGYMKWLLHAT